MNLRHNLTVFAAAARLGLKAMFAERLVLFGSFLTYAALVVAYSNIFRNIPAQDLTNYHLTLSGMIWYFGATEFVIFCTSFSQFKEVQYDIQTEQIYLSLLRPCSHWIVRVGEWTGQSVTRFLVLFLPSMALVAFMAGDFGPGFGKMLGYVASLPMAMLILLCSNFMLGVACLWIVQADPAYWVWNKFLFFFGALLWPLTLYPPFLCVVAWISPFPSIFAAPAQWMLNTSAPALLGGAAHQMIWLVFSVMLVMAVSRAMLRRIQKSGA